MTGDALHRQRGFAIHSNHTRTSAFDFPRSGENGNHLRRRKMGITFAVVRLFPQRLLLIKLLLAPLNFVPAWTWLLKLAFFEGISGNGKMYDVESSFWNL
jgi:hypothetical protein